MMDGAWRRGHGERLRKQQTSSAAKSKTRNIDTSTASLVCRVYEPTVDPFRVHHEEFKSQEYHEKETQTEDEDLGRFGPIHLMNLDTVDHLIQLLLQRKEYLENTAEMELTETNMPMSPPEDTVEDGEDSGFQLKRSRSYEALVQMEAILEARHQQLMQHGTLEAYDTQRTPTTNRMDDIQDEIARMHMQMLPSA